MQAVRHPGISAVYEERLAPAGANDIYIRALPELAGTRVGDVTGLFLEAIVLGIVRVSASGRESVLAPPAGLVLASTDHLVFIATSFEACTPTHRPSRSSSVEQGSPLPRTEPPPRPRTPPQSRRVLVLGWNEKLPALVRELALAYETDGVHEVDIFSMRPMQEREAALASDIDPTKIRVRQLEGDCTAGTALLRLDPTSYDSLVLVASDWFDSEEESDARTILGHFLLEEAVASATRRPAIVTELMDAENIALLKEHQSEIGDVLTKTKEKGGLGLGTVGSSAVLAAVLIALVIWAMMTQSHEPSAVDRDGAVRPSATG